MDARARDNLRSRSEGNHNRVHRWVSGFLTNPDPNFDAGGTMLKMTSPNDPIFFLHHAQIDRMWNIWQARHPGTTPYLPDSGAATGHNLNDDLIFHHPGETPPWPGTERPSDLLTSHTIHGTGVWYDTDIPEITLETPAVDFGNVPEGLTTFRAARFRVKTCQRTWFRITVPPPAGNFGLAEGQTDFYVDPQDGADEVFGLVFFQFHSVAGPQPPVMATIQPFIVDSEGEYTGTIGAEFNVGPAVVVTLMAASVPRTDYAVALVLDRSYSMSTPAGSMTRSQLLRNAVSVFVDLMRDTEQLGVVSFDDQVATLTSPAIRFMDAGGKAAVHTIAESSDLDPRGDTGIGLGITEGHNALLTSAAGLTRAMLVFTDGHENVPPDVSALPDGIIDSRTYAIGFGRVNDVNRDVLDDITERTDGDLIITGEIDSDQQRFLNNGESDLSVGHAERF